MVNTNRPLAAILVSASVLLAGCVDLPSLLPNFKPAKPGSHKAKIGFAQFPDIPIPPGAKMDTDRSLVLGARDSWIGRLAIKIDRSSSSIYDFYVREMGRFGWREITTVRSEVSVLTYEQGQRIATVQIWHASLGGAKIDITVSPRGKILPPAERPNTPMAPPPFK